MSARNLLIVALLCIFARFGLGFFDLHHFGVGGEAPFSDADLAELKAQSVGASVKPVVLIPPLTGTQLYAKLDHAHAPHFFCRHSEDWHRVWMNLLDELPVIIDCWTDNLKLYYNSKTGMYDPPKGVQVKTGEGVAAVTCLDPSKKEASKTVVYGYIIQLLQAVYGYEIGKNLVAHPYDWRQGPTSYFVENGTFAQLKQLIEETVENNGGVKAVLPAISMGCPYANLFLSDYVDAEWKAKYIDTFFSISGVFAGTAETIRYMLSPDNWRGTLPEYTAKAFTGLVRYTPSVAWVSPFKGYFGDEPIVVSPDGNFTVDGLADALRAAGADEAAASFERSRKYLSYKDPGVHVECLYGYGVPTINGMVYDSPLKDQTQPTQLYSDGDGTVPRPSLEACTTFSDVVVTSVFNQTHTGLINFDITYQRLLKVVVVED
mmetsp:Transcript_23771/g.60009  ORF Transcript_23771/g.60009 Transcript_23771/m.60009 type:complete len:432 (-) Transcript_23771:229-1524(-)